LSEITTYYPWGDTRRIHAASNYLRKTFGSRIQKLTIDAGFTCPNRDGTKGVGGCSYCNNDAFNPSYCDPQQSISWQLEKGIRFHENRYRKAPQFFAYFQAYSNTYATLPELKARYSEALANPKVIGLILGTRPDCMDEGILEYLATLAEKYYVVIEYGLESVYDRTLERINRGHTFEESLRALELTRKYGLKAGVHLIFGLPGESRADMMASADIISELPLHTIKFHQLQIVKGTRFALEYQEAPSQFDLFSLEEYIDFMCDYLGSLNPEIIVERLAGESQPDVQLSEPWGLRYDQVLKRIEEQMARLDTWQGKYFKN